MKRSCKGVALYSLIEAEMGCQAFSHPLAFLGVEAGYFELFQMHPTPNCNVLRERGVEAERNASRWISLLYGFEA